MTRTFSLRWLLLLVTVASGLLGLAVNFPDHAIGLGWFVGTLVPSMILLLLLSLASPRPRSAIACGLLGATVFGFIFMPAILGVGPEPQTIWDYFVTYYLPTAIPASVGALITGGAVVLDDRRAGPSDHQPSDVLSQRRP
ncbi:MAG: hypothetical protein SFU86_02970 [Pirellulaceae bacterium]|nr:hypothetical protein [Pirellulaceae bacterium]